MPSSYGVTAICPSSEADIRQAMLVLRKPARASVSALARTCRRRPARAHAGGGSGQRVRGSDEGREMRRQTGKDAEGVASCSNVSCVTATDKDAERVGALGGAR
jgi:hypothetical protein